LINSNLYVYKLSLNYRSFKAIAGCSPDSSSSRTAHQHTQRATPRSAQNWLRASCPDIITKDQWLPNSLNIKPVDYLVLGAMLEAYRKLETKPKTSAELKEALQVRPIWGNLPQGPIDKTVKDFSNKATGGWRCCLELAVNTSNICNNNRILASDHNLTVLFQRCY